MSASADKRAPAFDENGVMPFSIGSHCDLFPVPHFPESAGLVQGPAGGILRKDRGPQGPVPVASERAINSSIRALPTPLPRESAPTYRLTSTTPR